MLGLSRFRLRRLRLIRAVLARALVGWLAGLRGGGLLSGVRLRGAVLVGATRVRNPLSGARECEDIGVLDVDGEPANTFPTEQQQSKGPTATARISW